MMKKSECLHCKSANGSRRDFMRMGALGVLGITMSDFLRFQSLQALAETAPAIGKAKAVILLLLEGGISHCDTWDLKPSSRFKPISTNAPGVQISEIFPSIAKHMD